MPEATIRPPHVRSKSSTTPTGITMLSPGLSGRPKITSPSLRRTPGVKQSQSSTPSTPNYFALHTQPNNDDPLDTNAAAYAKNNWKTPQPAEVDVNISSVKSLPKDPSDQNRRFENFRRQSESVNFSLNQRSLSGFNLSSPRSVSRQDSDVVMHEADEIEDDEPQARRSKSAKRHEKDSPSHSSDESAPRSPGVNASQGPPSRPILPGAEQTESPFNSTSDVPSVSRPQISHIDDRHPRNSLPNARIDAPVRHFERAETLPSKATTDGPTLLAAQEMVDVIKDYLPEDVLILDLRVYAQYSQSRIEGAVNLCIPTTLLKRPSYNVQKLSETFSNKKLDREKFDSWKEAKVIVVYDASSWTLPEATSCVNMLKKFTNEKWGGATYVLKGGFASFAQKFPALVNDGTTHGADSTNSKKLSIDPPSAAPVAGGCVMPATQNAANPFFGTIRQNMDLIGGVGQMNIQLPSQLDSHSAENVPEWLLKASNADNKGKLVSDRFLAIETDEQERMKKALTANVSFGSPQEAPASSGVQVAGIEKGSKNRYKDILPFDHSRVRLHQCQKESCDYINASHIRPAGSSKHYIASQAPIPGTFNDFWRSVWEQDVRLILMLTAESEGGNIKSHPYWISGEYGDYMVEQISETQKHLDRDGRQSIGNNANPTSATFSKAPLLTPSVQSSRPSAGNRRHSTKTPSNNSAFDWSKPIKSPTSSRQPSLPTNLVTVRKILLTYAHQSSTKSREITQIQYAAWPDFGAPAKAEDLLALVDFCDTVKSDMIIDTEQDTESNMSRDHNPTLVHCSAGCGRTGTFCTVDTVIEKLKRQRSLDNGPAGSAAHPLRQTASTDLIAQTVADLRRQRISMVQTLRQFVLCYESVLEWCVLNEK